MTHWMRPPELARTSERDGVDPVIEGARHGLSREVSLAIWTRVCADFDDRARRLDRKHARQRFHELAVRVAARGGRLEPDVGRLTRVAVESDRSTGRALYAGEFAALTPGRQTLVAAEQPAGPLTEGNDGLGSLFPDLRIRVTADEDRGPVGDAAAWQELPEPRDLDLAGAARHLHAHTVCDAVYQALVDDRALDEGRLLVFFGGVAPELLRTALTLLQARTLDGMNAFTLLDLTTRGLVGRLLGVAPLTVGAADAAEEREAETAAAADGATAQLDGVRIHADRRADRIARSFGAHAFALGNDLFFSAGAYAPDEASGRRLLMHEVEHALQVRRSGADNVVRRSPGRATGHAPTSETPVAMSFSLAGITFIVPENITFRAGPRPEQGIAVMLRRLVGAGYSPGMEHRVVAYLRAGTLTTSGTLHGVARGGESMGALQIAAETATRLLGWLDAQPNLAVDVTAAQRELLSVGVAATQAWHRFPHRDRAELGTSVLPAWLQYDLFVQEIARFGPQLRAYVTALERYRASQAEPDRVAAVAGLRVLLDAINVAANVLEAIRNDAALVAHDAYRMLWPVRQGEPPRQAEPDQAPDLSSGELFMMFARTQSTLSTAALRSTDARRELLNRFGRFFLNARPPLGTSGDQVIQNAPSRANAQSHPSTMSSYPVLQPPLFEAALQTDHRFVMQLQFPSVLDAFARYSYLWERVRVPDSQIGGVIDAATAHGERPSWNEVGSVRFNRASRYARADIGRAVEQITSSLGSAGVGALDIAAAAAIFRYVGTSLRVAFEIITQPAREQPIVFPEEGLYLVRCRAVPITGDNDEVVRAPSVAYLPVFATPGQRMAEQQTAEAQAMNDQAVVRLAEIERLLAAQGDVPDRAALETERADLQASTGSVEDRVHLQQRQLTAALARLPPGPSSERRLIEHQLESLQQVLEVRARRERGGALGNSEVINASFVGDEGQVIHLLMEAAPRPAQDRRTRVYVSDLTTPNSGHATGSGGDRTSAILDAIQQILESGSAYGRGNVSVHIDDRTFSRRIEASQTALLMETIENMTMAISIAAVAAAPFTGGATLAILLPVGAIGAIPSAYRLATRAENGTLRFDLQTAMDVVNIAGGLIGLGSAATPLRMVRLGQALMIAGIGAGGAGMLLMGAGVISQIEELQNLPPGLRAARVLEVVGQALINAGIMIGTVLAERARAGRMEQGVGESAHGQGGTEVTTSAEPQMQAAGTRQRPGGGRFGGGGEASLHDFLTDPHPSDETRTLRDRIRSEWTDNESMQVFEARPALQQLRRNLLTRRAIDVPRVGEVMRGYGRTEATPQMLDTVFRYLFDSGGIAFTYENYAAWERLAGGRGTMDDVRFVVHEMAEVGALQHEGVDFMGDQHTVGSQAHDAWYTGTFEPAYARAHAQALQVEFQFVSEQISRLTDGALLLSPAEVAAVDSVNPEAREYLIVDGVPVARHAHYREWLARATSPVELSPAMRQRIGLPEGRTITLEQLVRAIKQSQVTGSGFSRSSRQPLYLGPSLQPLRTP